MTADLEDHLMRPGTVTEPQATCGAKLKTRPGELCPMPPMHGQARCRMHGGAAKQNRAAASKRLAEQQLVKAVKTFGLRRDIAPEEALLEELQWTAGHVAWLRGRVQDLEPEALVWGLTEEKDVGSGEFGGVDRTESAQPSVWWVLYERERKHLLALIHEANVAKIEERRVVLAERQGARLAEQGRAYIAGVIDALGLDAAAAAPVMQRLFAEMLRSLAGGPLQVTA